MAADISMENCADRIERGDPKAEQWLVEAFYGRIFAMALVRTGDREVARDLAQEVMMAVLCSLREGKLNEPDALTGYIFAAARNRIAYFFRHRNPVSSLPTGEIPDVRLPDPEEMLRFKERRQRALEAIESLNPSEQRILRLTLVEGLKSGEVAERLQLKPEIVRKRKSRAIRRLQRILRKGRSHS